MKVEKQSLISALANFRQELKELNIPHSKMVEFMEQFKDAYEESGDKDLAENEVFGNVMDYVGVKKSQGFQSFWKAKIINDRQRTVHFSDLDKRTYLSIIDQLREATKEGAKEGRLAEEVAHDFAEEYNLYFNDVFHWVWDRMNSRADLFGTYKMSKQVDDDDLVRQAKPIIERAKKTTATLSDVIGAVAIGLGISYALATKIAQRTNVGDELRNKWFGSGSIQLG